MTVADDRSLVVAAQAGDRDSLDRLLRAHYDRILAICRRVTCHDADAADAAQHALLAIVRGLPSFDGRSSFATWAYRIATNASLDELRRRRRRPVPASDVAAEESWLDRAEDPGSAAMVEAVADRSVIEAALQSLPHEFRVAVVLRDVGDLDYADIADVLDIPLGTVKSRIARGRAVLAAALSGNPGAPDERPRSAP